MRVILNDGWISEACFISVKYCPYMGDLLFQMWAGGVASDYMQSGWWIVMCSGCWIWSNILPLRPTQNCRNFPDDNFKCIFLNENIWILIRISLKFVSEALIDNKLALVQIMAWCRPGDKLFSETMLSSSSTNICVTRLQCVKWRLYTYLCLEDRVS